MKPQAFPALSHAQAPRSATWPASLRRWAPHLGTLRGAAVVLVPSVQPACCMPTARRAGGTRHGPRDDDTRNTRPEDREAEAETPGPSGREIRAAQQDW
jgi:hypothetical protein